MCPLAFKYMSLVLTLVSYMTLRKLFFPVIFNNMNHLSELKIEYVDIGNSTYDWAGRELMLCKGISALPYNITEYCPFWGSNHVLCALSPKILLYQLSGPHSSWLSAWHRADTQKIPVGWSAMLILLGTWKLKPKCICFISHSMMWKGFLMKERNYGYIPKGK